MAHFVVQNLGAAAGQGIETRVAQTRQRVAERQAADFGDVHDLGGREAMAPDIEALLDRAQQILIPFDIQVRVQAALHQDAGAAQVDGLLDFLEDDFLRMHVAFGVAHGPVKRAKAAIFGAEIGVVDVAVDDVADHAFRMQLAADWVGGHADADQIVAAKQVDRFSACHHTEHSRQIHTDPQRGFQRSGAFK